MNKDNEYEYSINDESETEEEGSTSIVDEMGKLTVDNFESAIACGSSKADMYIIFNVTQGDLDKWCMTNYNGLHFDEAYSRVLRMAKNKFVSTLGILAERGNNTAMNLFASFLTHYADNSSEGVNIINNVPGGIQINNGKKESD